MHKSDLGFGYYEYEVIEYLTKKFRTYKPCVFIDIGAYVGYYLMLALKEGCDVIAFEPDPRNYALLRANAALSNANNQIAIFNKALSDRTAITTFKLSVAPSTSSMSRFLRKELVEKTIMVSCTTLDDVIKPLAENLLKDKHVIIKIDVEGAAYSVIRGALNTIATYKPIVVLEVHRTYDDDDEIKVVRLLRLFNYKFKVLERRGDENFILVLEHS
ncbi:MAG: FkbM family methyltransferase [Sulfolobales archaeon]|nr:FkbM family methyltransferase [Sulfolobales archaeon]